MRQVDLRRFRKSSFGRGVRIRADKIDICEGARLEDNVIIEAQEVTIGFDSVIEKNTAIKGLKTPMTRFKLGDNAFIGFNNQILVPCFEMLDYSQLHNSGLHSGYEPLTIGYNCWIGQNSILNATRRLQIGNNVRIGTQSQLWTHVASGELLEGCTLHGEKRLVLKDNVWIVGGAVISPGLVLNENTIVMTGAVLTKSTPRFSTFAGIPAKNVTKRLRFWRPLSLDDKYTMTKRFAAEFVAKYPKYNGRFHVREEVDEGEYKKFSNNDLVVVKRGCLRDMRRKSRCSMFDLSSKRYSKKRTKIEVDWIKFTVGFRARFLPIQSG